MRRFSERICAGINMPINFLMHNRLCRYTIAWSMLQDCYELNTIPKGSKQVDGQCEKRARIYMYSAPDIN